MNLVKRIEELCKLCGVSGFEHNLSVYLENKLKELNLKIYSDSMGNIIGVKKSKIGSGKVMLEAHIDEIGLMVKSIDKNGFLLVVPVGGIDSRILCGSSVIVHGQKDYVGVIGAKPPHLMDKEEYDEILGFENLYIDVGMTREDAVANIPLGTTVTFHSDFVQLKGSQCFSKAMDDRAAVAVLLECIDKMKDTELGYDLYICFSVQEEVGMRGANIVSYSVNPDIAIAIDVTHASTPDEPKGTFKCGVGPVICKGPNIHKSVCERFIKVLQREQIPFEIEVEGGNTGTDAWAIQTAKAGIPTMLVSLPLKYMHTPVETLSITDCEHTVEALCAFLKSFDRTEGVLC